MRPAASVRAVLAMLTLCALSVAWRVNVLVPSSDRPIPRQEVEAVILAGDGEVLRPAAAFKNSLANMVSFRAGGCDSPAYVMPGSLHNETYLYMSAIPGLDAGNYTAAVAYMGGISPPPGALGLYLHQLVSDLRHFAGGAAIGNSRYALYFLVPDGCDIGKQFVWKDVWPLLKN
jgi:hypothetical protein